MDGTPIGITSTLHQHDRIAPTILYRLVPSDFRVVEVDRLGRSLLPISTYEHPPEIAQQDRGAAREAKEAGTAAVAFAAPEEMMTLEKAFGDHALFAKLKSDAAAFESALSAPNLAGDAATRLLSEGNVVFRLDKPEAVALLSFQPKPKQPTEAPPAPHLHYWVASQLRTVSLFLSSVLQDGVILIVPHTRLRALCDAGGAAQGVALWKWVNLSDDGTAAAGTNAFTFNFLTNCTKDQRGRVHDALASFCDVRNSSFKKRRQRADDCSNMSERTADPAGEGKFVHFLIEKVDVPAFEATRLISSFFPDLRRENECQVSGTKDRRAMTLQVGSLPLSPNVRLTLLEPCFKAADQQQQQQQQQEYPSVTVFQQQRDNHTALIRLSRPVIRSQPVQLGQHSGNQFQIRLYLRGVHNTKMLMEMIKQRCMAMRLESATSATDSSSRTSLIFGNFFGPQRFGVSLQNLRGNISEAGIGILIAQGRYEDAVKSLFDSASWQDSEEGIAAAVLEQRQQLAVARDFLWPVVGVRAQTGSAHPTRHQVDQALRMLPSSATACRQVLQNMRTNEGVSVNFRQALFNMPFEQQQIWVHSAQSFIFNRVLSKLLEDGGAEGTLRAASHDNLLSLKLPLLGAATFAKNAMDSFQHSAAHKKVQQVLAELEIRSPDDFSVNCSAVLGKGHFRGTSRNAFAVAKDFQLSLAEDPDRGTVHMEIVCDLPAGSFVSVLVRELLGEFPKEP